MSRVTRWWFRAFLAERPSISLGLFRLAVAFTVGAHMMPHFFHMDDTYLSTAFKSQNTWFFPLSILQLVQTSPDWMVWSMVLLFCASWGAFAFGLFAQASGIVMTLSCYYFYALNDLHIGTLSFDILLVTLFLLCVTGYHGDFLSLDSLRRGDADAYKRTRPMFIQRLLQLQLVQTFWGTALSKITAGGNWLTGNPYYHLMHYPPASVVRDFPLREWLGTHPELCYALGIACVIFEFTLPVLWCIPRTRMVAIGLGIAFQLMLWLTLHVPTIFLFLFPPMMLLFIAPEHLVAWIERRQAQVAAAPRGRLLYDGHCGFCLESIKRLRVLDLFRWVELRDVHAEANVSALHPSLTKERCEQEMVLIEPGGRLSGGFHAFRRLCVRLPLLWPLAPLVHLPGADWIGTRVYRWIAAHRYLLRRNPAWSTHQCALPGEDTSSSNT